MRIVAGSSRGISLKSLPGNETRPTSDKVKESLFNRIGPYFDGGVVVDLFGGSGSLALEALSRGADEAIVFEKNAKACTIIRANAEKSRLADRIHIERADAKSAVVVLRKQEKIVDYLFIDPPYAETKYYELAQKIAEADLLSNRAIVICEHDKKMSLPETFGLYQKSNCTVYGNSAISIYKK
ncbi:16S rRNA (guanine(966)-N(2))-methyltransferase RsmD [Sporosarcina sp. G11-34]|uniref:16S rRNA (guanine(966)-N(2))-methyltransferase RsmD n=1 Tax=Sporosarcina sp. G11-34 TaxID=2849605 RepID=UPI0022A90307|nr:16S rRNA (guanine(966)-N(2))-methyltransferase RsmD [Sporosarcina sp. G11-34]MCZ2258894.1 16S rRNA (guanine(966)-N(2))-methyltransferase RsmD [Sporosarcina sp. G11-34]